MHHEVSGDVLVLDDQTLAVKNFNYDGIGPEAFFLVGSEGEPSLFDENKTAILAHPFTGIHYDYSDEGIPVLGAFEDTDIILTLPPHMKTSQIAWISVWCRKFRTDFGSLVVTDQSYSEDEVKNLCFFNHHSSFFSLIVTVTVLTLAMTGESSVPSELAREMTQTVRLIGVFVIHQRFLWM